MVGIQGYEVVFRKNKHGGMGSFVRRPGTTGNQVFPVHLNAQKLPVLPIKGFKYAWESRPDSLEDYARELLASCEKGSDKQVDAVAREVEKQLNVAFKEAAADSSSDYETDSDDASSWEDDFSDRRSRQVYVRNRAAKSRRKAVRALLGKSDLHRILHRGKKQTFMTFARPEVKVTMPDGKVKTGDELHESDFEEACSTCDVTRMKASATNRPGKVHAEACSSRQ